MRIIAKPRRVDWVGYEYHSRMTSEVLVLRQENQLNVSTL